MITALFVLAGIVLLFFAYRTYTKGQEWLKVAKTTTGTVLELIIQREGKTNSYYPVMQFEVEDKSFQFTSKASVNFKTFKVGTIQPVWYNPQNPQDAKINATVNAWLLPAILALMGLVFIGMGLFVSEGYYFSNPIRIKR